MAESWHVAKGKTKLGPYSREQLKRLAKSGELEPSAMVLPADSGKWVQAGTVAGIFDAVPVTAVRKGEPERRPSASGADRGPPKRNAPPAKRSTAKIIAIVGAALVACGCLAAIPLAAIAYFLVSAPVVHHADAPPVAVAEAARPAVPDAPVVAPPPNVAPPVNPPAEQPPPAPPPRVEPPAAPPPSVDPPAPAPRLDPPPQKNPPAGDQLTAAALQTVKQATVYVRVTLPDGRIAQGSGFLAGGPNVILTNGHVLGMLSPEGRPPRKIEVVFNSGTPKEKTCIARLGQVDSRDDLAALVVDGDALPAPLAIGLARDLHETQTVFVFGFPFGKQLGRNISVNKTTVSSIRTKKGGSVQDIVVGGGMHPGNSGGPVVDGNGLVVGVSVAIIQGTQINFAIAGETVQNFLAGRMDKRVFMSPYREGGQLKLPIRYHMTDPVGRIAKVVVDTWIGKPGKSRPIAANGADPLPDDSPRRSYDFGYRQRKAEGEVDLPVMQGEQALWVQLAIVRPDGTRKWYQASAYPNKMAPVERKPVVLSYAHRPEVPCKLEVTQTTDLKLRDLSGTDKHLVTEIKGHMVEQMVGKPDATGSMAAAVVFKKVTVKTTLDKKLATDPILNKSLRSVAALRALTAINNQGDLKPARVAINPAIRDRDTVADLAYVGMQLLQALEAVTVPLPGREVRHEQPWKVQRKILLGSSARSAQSAVLDVDCVLHGLRERNGRPEAVVFLFGQVRGAPGAVLSAGGYMDGTAVVDLKTNQVRFADANLNLDLDIADGKEHFQANGTRKITLVRTPLEGAERDQVVKGSGVLEPPSISPAPKKPAPPSPVGGGKTKIRGGGRDPEFSEAAPDDGLLIGFELGLKKFFNNDVVRAMRPIFSAGDKNATGTPRGTDFSRTVRVVAKPGYAVGAITAKAGLTVDGMSVTFMKIGADGRLDPADAYESDWVGGQGGGGPMRLGGDGTPVIGVIGRTNRVDMTGLGLLLRQ